MIQRMSLTRINFHFANFENGESDDGSVDVPFTDRDINYILNKVALPSTLLKAGTTISLRKFSSYITDNEDDENQMNCQMK